MSSVEVGKAPAHAGRIRSAFGRNRSASRRKAKVGRSHVVWGCVERLSEMGCNHPEAFCKGGAPRENVPEIATEGHMRRDDAQDGQVG